MPFKKKNTVGFWSTSSLEVDFSRVMSKKEKKKLKKIIKKYKHNLIHMLEDDHNYFIYKIDSDLFVEEEKEKYYKDLLKNIYENYKSIIQNDNKFHVKTESGSIIIHLKDSSNQVKLEILPYSIITYNQLIDEYFEFGTKKNLFKKFYTMFLEIESYIDDFNNRSIIDNFKNNHKLDRSDNIDKVLGQD